MHQYGDCYFCGGQVKEKKIELDYRYKGKLHVFQAVPTGVCVQCGEKYLTAHTAKVIEKMIRSRKKPGKTIAVPVKVFTDVAV